MGKNKRLKVHR